MKKTAIILLILLLSTFALTACETTGTTLEKLQFVSVQDGEEIVLGEADVVNGQYSLIDNPVKENYEFVGWYVDEALTIEFTPDYLTSNPILPTTLKLYAKWQEIQPEEGFYLVKFYINLNGQNIFVNQQVVEHGKDATLPQLDEQEGYTFIGWSDNYTNITEDTDVIAKYVKQVTITYDLGEFAEFYDGEAEDGKIVQNYNSGSVVYADSMPKPEFTNNATFLGWYYDSEYTMPVDVQLMADKDVVLYAKTQVFMFTVYGLNNSIISKNAVVAGSELSVFGQDITTEIEGYKFKGWFVKTNNLPFDFDSVMPQENLSVYALYEANLYKMTFVDPIKGDESYDIEYGTNIGNFSTKTASHKTGYEFIGWSTNKNGSEIFDFNTTMPANDLIFYPSYQAKIYTITFVDGIEDQVFEVAYGSDISSYSSTEASEKQGYIFKGWQVEGKQEFFDFNITMPAGNIVLVAKYDIVPVDKYTLTFKDGISQDKIIFVGAGESLTGYKDVLPADKEGYSFDYWYTTDEDFAFDFNTPMPQNNIVLYAKYSLNSYTLTFIDNVNENIKIQLPYGTSLIDYSMRAGEKEGHSFDYWYSDDINEPFSFDTTMPARDITLYAKYSVLSYNLIFSDGIAQDIVFSVVYGTALTEYANTQASEKQGYLFVGWYEEGSESAYVFNKMPAKDVVLTAKYVEAQENVYTLTFSDKVGQDRIFTVAQGASLATYKDTKASEKEGYTFEYWYQQDGIAFDFDGTMPAQNIVLYAKYTINKYMLTFDGASGEGIFKVAYGASLMSYAGTQAVEKEGYTFAGWYEKDSQQVFDFDSPMPANDVTLYAKYNINSYTLTFDGASGQSEYAVEYGSSLASYENTQAVGKDGYTFVGWYEKQSEQLFDFDSAMPAKNIELYAVYEINSYTLTFDGASGQSEYVVEYGASLADYADTQAVGKEGYDFVGWYEKQSQQLFDFDSTMPAKDVELYAEYSVISYTLTFVGASGQSEYSIEYGTSLADYADTHAADKEGHTFAYWYEETSDKAFDFNTAMPARNIVLSAKYTVNEYTLLFVDSVGEDREFSVPYGTSLADYASTQASDKEGYTFVGWYEGTNDVKFNFSSTMPAREVVLNAKYTINTYTITFIDESGQKKVVVNYGEDLATYSSSVSPSIKEGHSFSGWYEGDSASKFDFNTKMPARNIELTAKYTVNTYKLIYDYGTGETQTVYYEYGEQIAKTDIVPEKTGYTFEYWYEGESTAEFDFAITMPARNITLNAKYQVNYYKLIFVNPLIMVNNEVKTVDVAYGTSLKNFAYGDYVYDGLTVTYWYETDKSQAFDFEKSAMPAQDLTLYAYFNIATHTVTYNYNGGTASENAVTVVEAKTGDILIEPEKPTKTDSDGNLYVFGGWFTDLNVANSLNSASTDNNSLYLDARFEFEKDKMPDSDLTLYAGYFMYAQIDEDGLYSYNYHTFSENKTFSDSEYTASTAYIPNQYFGIAYEESHYQGIVGGHMLKNIPYEEYLTTYAPAQDEAIFLVYGEGFDAEYYNNIYGENIIGRYVISSSYDYNTLTTICTNNRTTLNKAISDANSYYNDRTPSTGLKPVVYVVGGYYFTYQLNVLSGVTLRIARDSALIHSPLSKQYASDEALIYANNASDITIEGPGKIIGLGSTYMSGNNVGKGDTDVLQNPNFRENNLALGTHYDVNEAWKTYRERCAEGETEANRDNMMLIMNSTNVTVRNIEVRESGVWTLKFFQCTNVHVYDTIINNNMHVANTDGIDVVSCSQMLVEHNFITTGDDGIVLKARAYESNKDGGREIQDVVIRNNQIMSLTNGMKIGTEIYHNVTNIHFENNDIFVADIYPGAYSAISLETRYGASLNKITVKDTRSQGTYSALYIGNNKDKKNLIQYYGYGDMTNITVTGSRANDCDMAMLVVGGKSTDKIANLAFSDIIVKYYDGFNSESTSTRSGAYETSGYPEIVNATGNQLCRAYGLNITNAENAYASNITVISRSVNSTYSKRGFTDLSGTTTGTITNTTVDRGKTINGVQYYADKGTIGELADFESKTSAYKADISWLNNNSFFK